MNLFELFFLILFSKKQIANNVETTPPVINDKKTEVINTASNKIIKSVSKRAEENSPVLSAVATAEPTSSPTPKPTVIPTLKPIPTLIPIPTSVPTIIPLPSIEPCPRLPIKPGKIHEDQTYLVYCPDITY